MTFDRMTLSKITVNIITMSRITFSCVTFFRMAFRSVTFRNMTFGRLTFGKVAFGRMTFWRITFGRAEIKIIIVYWHLAKTLTYYRMTLSRITFSCTLLTNNVGNYDYLPYFNKLVKMLIFLLLASFLYFPYILEFPSLLSLSPIKKSNLRHTTGTGITSLVMLEALAT
jgi:hypothetical protein